MDALQSLWCAIDEGGTPFIFIVTIAQLSIFVVTPTADPAITEESTTVIPTIT
jgi:hypothetical protein